MGNAFPNESPENAPLLVADEVGHEGPGASDLVEIQENGGHLVPEGVEARRVGLAEAVAETRDFQADSAPD